MPSRATLDALPLAAAILAKQRDGGTASAFWTPLPGPQTQALESEADVLGFGGAAGPGKSTLLLGLAVTRHRRSVIFRREKTQVRDLWDKLGAICGTRGRSNENLGLWRDLPGDRAVELGGVKDEDDWRRYMGREYDLFGFDELPEFSEEQFRTLIAWNRTSHPGQRCRVVAAFNPPAGAEGEWIISYFGPWLDPTHPDPAEPGELRWYTMLDHGDGRGAVETPVENGRPFTWRGETVYAKSRTFIPARLEDNPILEATGYRAQLQGLPEPRRSQLLYGDFSIGLQSDPWQVIPTAWVIAAQERWRADGRPRDEQGVLLPLTATGVDIAQGGQDRTVLARRCADWYAELEVHPGSDTPDAAANAALVRLALVNGGYATIDANGVGASTYHLLKPELKGRVRAFVGSDSTDAKDKSEMLHFLNVRAAAWWAFREALDPESGHAVALPPDRELRAELCAPKHTFLTNGVKIESKEDVRKRLGRSIDKADAVVMSWWDDPMARLAEAFQRAVGQTAPVVPGRVEQSGDPRLPPDPYAGQSDYYAADHMRRDRAARRLRGGGGYRRW